MSNRVAICIPTYNQAAFVAGAVRSALGQTSEIEEVIVSDDASDDGTADVLAELVREDSRVQVLRNSERLGISGNADRVLRSARSEYVIRLDSDDLLEPGYVEAMLALFAKYPRAGAFHGNVREIDGTGTIRRFRLNGRTQEWQSAEDALRQAPFRFGVTANICGFRREALEGVRFTTGRPNYLEDYDLWVRLAAADWGNVFANEVLASYRVWTDAKGQRARRKAMELEGFIRMFDESIEPAFRARGWSTEEVARARRKQAMQQVAYFGEVKLSPGESREIAGLVRTLGGPSLRVDCCVAIGQSPFRRGLKVYRGVWSRLALWKSALRRLKSGN